MKKVAFAALLFAFAVFADADFISIGSGPAQRIKDALFANLATPVDDNVRYCTDCAVTAPCTGSGSGAFAFRTGSVWNCTNGSSGGSAPFSDATAIVKNASDATKTVTIDASGVTAGNTVTLKGRAATGFGIGTATTADAIGDNLIAATATTQTPLVLQVKAVPTADWFRVESSAGSTGAGFRVNSDGGAFINAQTANVTGNFLTVQFQGANALLVANGATSVYGTVFATTGFSGGGGGSAWVVDTNGWQDTNPGKCYVSADQTSTSASLATTTCSVTLQNASHYRGQCEFFLSDSVAADGAQIDFGGGTATAGNFRAQVTAFDTALNLSSQKTSISSAATASTFTGAGAFEVHFSIETSSTGTFIPRFAQAAHTTGTLTLAKGSYCVLEKMP